MEIKKHFGSFSAAIRFGAAIRPQTFGRLFVAGRSCSIGAGVEAMQLPASRDVDTLCYGLSSSDDTYIALGQAFPYLFARASTCPLGHDLPDDYSQDYYGLIVHLNDEHRWTREQVADWLQGIEDELFGYVTLENVPEIQDTCNSKDSVDSLAQAGVLN